MRYVYLSALLASATALSGCVGGDGSAFSLSAASIDVCGVNDGNCATASTSQASSTTTGTGTTGTGTTGTTTPTSTNVGNTTNLTTGDATITLEKEVITSTKATPALSKLTLISGATNTAKIQIDTNTATNASWPIAKTMDENLAGTNAYPAPNGLEGDVLGGTYKEYRSLSNDPVTNTDIDEELQVWSFQSSQAIQYRDISGGSSGAAPHQAWSFGGTKTSQAAMTLKGSGTYVGKFGATAQTRNYIDPTNPLRTVSSNNEWSIVGDSNLTANFLTNTFSGTLTPREWHAWASLNNGAGFATVLAGAPLDPNWNAYMNDQVILKGTITNSLTTGNAIVGTATLDPTQGWLTNSSSNAMYASVFGTNANEITGVFGVHAIDPSPLGGYRPITDDRRGYITMSGVFNGQ